MRQEEISKRESSRNGIGTTEEAAPFGLDFAWPEKFWLHIDINGDYCADADHSYRNEPGPSFLNASVTPLALDTDGDPITSVPSNLEQAMAIALALGDEGVILAAEDGVTELARWYVR